jgi:sugar phosphate isomerase/epimerase
MEVKMSKYKVAVQLYSIREEVEKDMEMALRKVKEMGYDSVEFAGFYGKSVKEIKSLLSRNGLTCETVHQDVTAFREDMDATITFLKELGVKYCAIPYYPLEEWRRDFDGVIEFFTKISRGLSENGIQLLYHHHDFEFQKIGNQKTILDALFEAMPSPIIEPQIDTCWVHYAGFDPVTYIKKYGSRVETIHLKDYVLNDKGEFEFRPFGQGIQNVSSIIDAINKVDVKIFVVEQDNSPDRPIMEALHQSRACLKSFGI